MNCFNSCRKFFDSFISDHNFQNLLQINFKIHAAKFTFEIISKLVRKNAEQAF